MIPTNRKPHATSHLFGKPAAEATSVLGSRRWPRPGVPARVSLGSLVCPRAWIFLRRPPMAGNEGLGPARGAGGGYQRDSHGRDPRRPERSNPAREGRAVGGISTLKSRYGGRNPPLTGSHRPALAAGPPRHDKPHPLLPLPLPIGRGARPSAAVAMQTPPPRGRPEGGAGWPWGRGGGGREHRAVPAPAPGPGPGPAPAPMHGAEEAVAAGGPRVSAASTQTDSMAGERRPLPAVGGLAAGGAGPGPAPAVREPRPRRGGERAGANGGRGISD